MALVVTIGGVVRTSVTAHQSVYVEQRAADFISVCGLRIVDVGAVINIAAEDAILLNDDVTGEVFFSGRVVDIGYQMFGGCTSRYIDIKCQDPNYQLGETVIDQVEEFPGGAGHGAITADADIIDHLFTDYLPAVARAHVATLQDPLTITFNPCTLRNMLSQICTRTGGYFYVDFANELHYFSAEAAGVAWWLSDTPDQVNSFSYLLNPLDMATVATTVLDGVFVIGSEISGWRGVHAPGDRQGIARDNRITTVQGIEDRGDAVLGKYGAPQVTYTVTTYKAGLRAGYDVRFVCGVYGVDDTFTVRIMVVKWDGCGIPYYVLTLGDVVNPSLIAERNWVDGLTDSVTITAPMLPTSSRGWTQDLVFSAADHNTVAWAGGDIVLADGTVYTIAGSDTGDMAATTYIYLDLDVADNALQTTDDAALAVGSRILLVAWATPQAVGLEATFIAFGGEGQGPLVDTANIADDAITTGKIFARTILAGDIAVNTITAGEIAAATITTNEIAANTILAGNIAVGTITTNEIAANTILAGNIAANTITADKINMGIGDGLFNAADGLLLLGPHCEITTTAWTSLRKQVAVISGAFHQEAGRWPGTRGLVVEEATTNLILNPSIEVDTTGWEPVSSVITRDTTYSMFGDAALKVVTDNAAAGEGFNVDVNAETAAATEYTLSAYLRGSGTVSMFFYDAAGGFQWGSVITLTNVWTRYELTKTFGAGISRTIGVRTDVQQGITFYCDGTQLEQQDYATSYCDGTLGTGYAWTGAAHGSTSTRAATTVNLDNLGGLISGNDTISFRCVAQALYDADATQPGHCTFFDIRGADNNNRIMCRVNVVPDDKLAVFINGDYRLVGSIAETYSAGDCLDIVVTLDFANNSYVLYRNGAEIDTDTTVLVAPVGITDWALGGEYDGSRSDSMIIVEYAVFDRVLTENEVKAMYLLTRPLIDLGSLDKPGIYVLDGRFRIASSTTGNRIEIDSEQIAGYDSAGVKQFYLQASDGKALAGGGAVRMDASGLYMVGAGASGDMRRLRFLYDDAGAIKHMGSVYGNYGGPGATYSWLSALRVAGDPWTGSIVILQAFDDVAASDVRITVNSDGNVGIGGDLLVANGDVQIDGAKLQVGDGFWMGIAGPSERIVFDSAGYIDVQGARLGVNVGGVPEAKVDFIQSSETGGLPVQLLNQADLSEDFIRFKATVGAGNPIDTTTPLGAYYGRVRVSVWGVAGFKYLALYNP